MRAVGNKGKQKANKIHIKSISLTFKRFYVVSFEQKKCDIWVGINLTFTLRNKSSGTLDKMRCSNLQNKQNKHTRSLLWPLTTWKWKYWVINSSRKMPGVGFFTLACSFRWWITVLNAGVKRERRSNYYSSLQSPSFTRRARPANGCNLTQHWDSTRQDETFPDTSFGND